MRKILLLLACICLDATWTAAQDIGRQVLVFRNTGEVNLLYENEIDSIVCSCFDSDSVRHDSFVSQVFFTADTALVVPLHEIDSVAFGSRDVMEYMPDVRILHETPIVEYIESFNGSRVCFRTDIPSDLIPCKGDKLFYGVADDLFPYGLSAKAYDVKTENGSIAVYVEAIPLSEIFSRYFFAGTVGTPQEALSRRAKEHNFNPNLNLNHEIPLGDLGKMDLFGEISVPIRFVANPLRQYYHMECSLEGSAGFDYKIGHEGTALDKESPAFLTLPLPTVAMVLVPRIRFCAFVSLKGEVDFRYAMQRHFQQKIIWTHRNGNNEWQTVNGSVPAEETDEASCDVILSGELFGGLQAEFQMGLLGNVAGARAKLRLGPEITGELSAGILNQLHTYNPDIYAKGVLDINLRLSLNTYLFHISMAWGEEEEYPVSQTDIRLNGRHINLFPEYSSTRAIQALRSMREERQHPVSVTTKNETPLAHELESGFELVREDETVVDSAFCATLLAQTTAVQGVEGNFLVPEDVADTPEHPLYVRPVFHYAGHTVRAQSKPVHSDCLIQPITAFHANGTVFGISGIPIIGISRSATTHFHVGSYLPIEARDTVFTGTHTLVTGSYISGVDADNLIGTWQGTLGKETVRLTFATDGTGSYTNLDSNAFYTFDYKTNTPQSGQITWYGENGDTQTCTVVSVTDTSLRLRLPKHTEIFTLNR